MTEPVKPKRRYDSPRRREQAAATRREILEAAQRLFERQGYAATTMAAIAAEAGVALKTVYVAFETKSGVLRALWNLLAARRRGRRPGRRARLVPRDARRARPGAPAPPQRPQLARRQGARRRGRRGDPHAPRRSIPRSPRCGTRIESRLPREPARDRREPRREERARARARRRPRHRHPLDDQPPERVAAARRRARLDARPVRAVDRRRGVPRTARPGAGSA